MRRDRLGRVDREAHTVRRNQSERGETSTPFTSVVGGRCRLRHDQSITAARRFTWTLACTCYRLSLAQPLKKFLITSYYFRAILCATFEKGDVVTPETNRDVHAKRIESRRRARAVGESLHHTAAAVRHSFTDAPSLGDPSALATVMRGASGARGGGRGGRARLAVLLSMIWVLRSGDHGSNRPARFWAELSGFDDPESDGARAVRDSFKTLQARGLIDHAEGPQGVPVVQLLREDGSGRPYSSPVASAPGAPVPEPYFRVPANLWERGMIGRLSGPALAMYVIVLRLWRTDQPSPLVWFSPPQFKERFGLAESTRKAGLRELVDQGVLIEEKRAIDSSGGSGNRMFRRNVYMLEDIFAP